MPTYSEENFASVAASVGADVAVVERHAAGFESAAEWHRIDRGGFEERHKPAMPLRPSQRRKRLRGIARSARSLLDNLAKKPQRKERIEASWRRLLKALRIEDPAHAEDGPGDQDIFQVLAFPEASSEDHVLHLVQQLVRVPQSPQDAEPVAQLERLAHAAIDHVTRIGALTVPKGHQGDRAVNDWMGQMAALYREITGREPATAVDPISGVAGGDFIHFLREAAKPVGIKDRAGRDFSEDAWRSRIRTVVP